MIQIAAGTKVYLACRPVGMRYGFDGLAAQVARVLAADSGSQTSGSKFAARRDASTPASILSASPAHGR